MKDIKIYHDDYNIDSKVKAVEEKLQVESSEQSFENLLKDDLKIASELLIYLLTPVTNTNKLLQFYLRLFQSPSVANIILTLNRMLSNSTNEESIIWNVNEKIFKRITTIF